MLETPPDVSSSDSACTIDPIIEDAASVLNPQHLRLLIDPLPAVKDSGAFNAWVRSAPVSGAWAEFAAAVSYPSPSPDSSTIVDKANAVLGAGPNTHGSKFFKLDPDKSGWSAADHHVRFVVTIISDCSLDARHGKKEWATAGLEEESPEVDPAKV